MSPPPNSGTLRGQLLWWFLSESEGRAHGRGVFVQSCNIVGTGGHSDSIPQGTFTKTFLPSPTPQSLCISPRSQALGGFVLRVSSSSLSTGQVKATDKDRLGSELKFAGREPRCKKDPSEPSREKDSGRALHPTPAGPETIQVQKEGTPEVMCSVKKEARGTRVSSAGPHPFDGPSETIKKGQRALWTLAPK